MQDKDISSHGNQLAGNGPTKYSSSDEMCYMLKQQSEEKGSTFHLFLTVIRGGATGWTKVNMAT